ncbi:TRIO and F-actin-binding protein [Merluccius polli]|uniref:TRIO and F-actin-binding protein n=1 Tax=Merluccius polli TaxID=89951 RepID=A0AA47M992_MERPO|nr:TRIO and F-actin-binding protein [Merluccius polli]
MTPDLLNFKKGWMSKMDDVGEWKKHWFVLTDAGLKYYRDSGAEEKDEPDGEIDLNSCLKVSEFDVEKNYGFQIQTREAVVTLSAMTAGIRRNWIEVLRKSVRPSRSPDLTQLPDSSSDKENSHGALLSARRASARPPSSPSQRRFDYVELSPLPVPAHPANQREAGEGQGKEHSQWQEGRNRDTTSSQWEALLSRKGPAGTDPWQRMEEEIENKWEEFERLPLKEMKALPISSQSSGQPANEALHREVVRGVTEAATGDTEGGRRRRGGGGGGGVGLGGGACGPDAACRSSLAALERAHRHALQEVQRQQERRSKEVQEEQERLLREETRATAQAMEALKKAHKEQLEREVERATRLCGRVGGAADLRTQLQADTEALQRELAGLSERYSHKCLELNRSQQDAAERERELSRRERDLDLLRKENQDLKARLVEAVGRSRSVGAGQGSGGVANDNRTMTSCELEVLVQVKEKEVEYLHQEIGCLRNELQALNTEKRLSSERRRELEAELSSMRGRSLREVQSLKEHLRLALAALQEGQVLGNSLEH